MTHEDLMLNLEFLAAEHEGSADKRSIATACSLMTLIAASKVGQEVACMCHVSRYSERIIKQAEARKAGVKYILVGSEKELYNMYFELLKAGHDPVLGDELPGNPGWPEYDCAGFVAALRYVFEQRLPGWFNQQNALIEHGVCNQAQFEAVYYGEMAKLEEAALDHRIGYTVGDPAGEHETRYLDEHFSLAEAKKRVEVMNSVDAKPGLRGAQLPPANYFYELIPPAEGQTSA